MQEILFKELGFLKFDDMKYTIGRLLHRWYNRKLPEMFHEYFEYVSNVHNYDTRQSMHLYVPYVRTNLGRSSISYRGPKIWSNIMINKINGDSSEAAFCKMLKRAINSGITDVSKCNWYSSDGYQDQIIIIKCFSVFKLYYLFLQLSYPPLLIGAVFLVHSAPFCS